MGKIRWFAGEFVGDPKGHLFESRQPECGDISFVLQGKKRLLSPHSINVIVSFLREFYLLV